MIIQEHDLPLTQQCRILELSRSSLYYQPVPVSDGNLELMRAIDEIHLKRPFYGPVGRSNSPTCGHLKFLHPVTA